MSMRMDQVREWYEGAEQVTPENLPQPGDTIIHPHGSSYTVEPAGEGWEPRLVKQAGEDRVRILERAPKPKPAWHDAVAVLAAVSDPDGQVLLTPTTEPGYWQSTDSGIWYDVGELRDVTPLIPAEVTDEMIGRLEKHFVDTVGGLLPPGLAGRMLAVALGLEAR